MNSISIIIPVYNEAKTISKLLWHLKTQATTTIIKEIIVVDGGSTDNTKQIALYEGVTVISSKKGRAKQMNYGAKHAKGSILYFLHADSFPPNGFDRLIFTEVEKGNFAGCFKMKFDSKHWWLKLAGWLTQFNWKASRGGDQSLFVTKDLFIELNGFNEQFTIYEDIDFINKLYRIKQFVVIQQWIITSSRRYQTKGIWKLQYHFWMIYIKKWFGASAEQLYSYYAKYIQ
jgi:rSAM/selenodomain-associated transferase 2